TTTRWRRPSSWRGGRGSMWPGASKNSKRCSSAAISPRRRPTSWLRSSAGSTRPCAASCANGFAEPPGGWSASSESVGCFAARMRLNLEILAQRGEHQLDQQEEKAPGEQADQQQGGQDVAEGEPEAPRRRLVARP